MSAAGTSIISTTLTVERSVHGIQVEKGPMGCSTGWKIWGERPDRL